MSAGRLENFKSAVPSKGRLRPPLQAAVRRADEVAYASVTLEAGLKEKFSSHFALVLAFSASLLASAPLRAEWHGIGAMTASPPAGNQIAFHNPQATVTVTVLAPDIIRVRMARGRTPAPDYSYAVVKTDWPQAAVESGGSGGTRVMRTAELEVRAQLSPFRLAFYDRGGRLISKDSDTLGTAWDGARVRSWKWMPPDEHYFGLGEKAGPLDKRGHAYVMWNTDAYGWEESTDPLYETIPFFIGLRHGRAYGIFFDNTWRSSFDMGAESPQYYSFGAEGGDINYYFFYGPDPKKVLGRYTELVGRTPLPPRWSIAYHQCRYSYYPESTVRFIADNFRQRRIPCDAIFLDIHYMDGYRVFTWDKSRFPDPPRMLSDLRRQGFRVVTIIDPGIKVDPNYWAYQQGVAGDYFVKTPDGKPYVGKVWPGESVFPDFTSDKARAWWGSLYKGLLSDGVAGIWNDMNEPAVFEVPSKTMDLDAVHYDHGLDSPHAKVHNIYGMLMSEGTRDGLLSARPDERPLVITRATYAGGERYAAVWTGDNSSTWNHLRISLPELMTMGLSGLALAGADVGGFALSPSPELYTRWLEAGVFYPYCRTHTELGSRNQEPWSFGNRMEDINRKSIELRYRLLPYLYNAFHESAETGLPVMRALLLDYSDDPQAVGQNEEFLFGDDLLVAPVVKDGEIKWGVYLPRGDWYDFWTDRRYTGPADVTVDAPLERIPIFVRAGAIVPTQQVVQYTDEAPINPLTFEIYPLAGPDGNSERDYYEDDGISFGYQRGLALRQRVSVSRQQAAMTVQVSVREGSYKPPDRSLVFKVHGQPKSPVSIEAGEKVVERVPSLDRLDQAPKGWFYDDNSNLIWIKQPDGGLALTTRIALEPRPGYDSP
ncbi:MAG: alpha-glucosidase [Acidobacteria bacterium]|nr:MAG: alpha-glucosidase [Acidobacteriota bacterium]